MNKYERSECSSLEGIENLGIEIQRGQVLIDKYNELSDFIADTNLPRESKSKLRRSIVELIKIAEMYALAQGIGMVIAPEVYQDALRWTEPKS